MDSAFIWEIFLMEIFSGVTCVSDIITSNTIHLILHPSKPKLS